MNDPWIRALLSSIAGMAPAVGGGMLFARFVAANDNRLYPSAFVLGIVCAIVVMAVSRGRGWDIVGAAVVVAAVGVILALLFDAKWNSTDSVARQLVAQHEGLTLAQATLQARTILGGMDYWELVRARLRVDNALIPVFAVVGAGLTVRSRLFGRLLRITDRQERDATGEPSDAPSDHTLGNTTSDGSGDTSSSTESGTT